MASDLDMAAGRLLATFGIDCVPQKAVGIYNIDLAVEDTRIAIELFGGSWHSTGRHKARHHRRCKYLFDKGWAVVIVWVDKRRHPFGVGACKKIVALAEHRRTSPAPFGEYHVIFGNGKPATTLANHFNTPADIERICGSGHQARNAS
jgi:very-short-patch-repair endonuclease